MLARLELLSFHAGAFCAASILVFFLLLIPGASALGGQDIALTIWVACSALMVAVLSKAIGAYRASTWAKARPHGASFLIAVGHVAPLATAYIYLAMLRSGTGSGVVFIPLIAWAMAFYTIGIIWCLNRLASAAHVMRELQRNATQSEGGA